MLLRGSGGASVVLWSSVGVCFGVRNFVCSVALQHFCVVVGVGGVVLGSFGDTCPGLSNVVFFVDAAMLSWCLVLLLGCHNCLVMHVLAPTMSYFA